MMLPLRRYAFLASCFAVPASAQYMDYEFRQAGPEAVALERVLFWAHPLLPSANTSPVPALLPETMPSTGAADVRGERSVLTLDRVNRLVSYIGQTRNAPVFAKGFPDVAAMRQAFPDGTYIVRYSGFAATYAAAQFTYHHAAPATPRVTNYEALQNWDGGELVIQWAPIANADNFSVQSECRILDPTGRVVVTFPMESNRLAAGMARVSGVNVPPGTALTCELPFDIAAGPPTPSETVEGVMGRTLPGRLLLRFAFRRAATPVPPTSPTATPPTITVQPAGATVLNGAPVTLTATASGVDLTYQWRRDGTAIPGATGSTLTLPAAGWADAGGYSVTVTNAAGTVTSDVARLTVNAVTRIANVSLLTSLAEPGDAFTLGYVVGGASATAAKPLVIRAAGQSLGTLGVPGTIENPRAELFAGAQKTGENIRWAGDARLREAMAAVGAFAFASADSRDAAALAAITGRDNSVKVSAADGGTGTVIAELYDATPAALFTASTPRLLNVSVLKSLGEGVTLGFVIAGTNPKSVLVRAIGPTLGRAPFGIAGVVDDPRLTIFDHRQSRITESDDWGGPAALSAAFESVGAFALPADSRDAALTAMLPPGNYTVEVKGVGDRTGIALIEVYELP